MQNLIKIHPDAYLIFDDTVLDKRASQNIELVRKQYSGNEHKVIRGIGLISCIYVNPESGEFWLINYRIVDDTGGIEKYKQIQALNWTEKDLEQGKLIKIKKFPLFDITLQVVSLRKSSSLKLADR